MIRTQKKVDSRLRWGEGSIRRMVNHDGDVRYQARWAEGEGESRRWPAKTFYVANDPEATKALAEDWLLKVARDKAAGIYTPRNQLTVKTLVDDYLERRKKSGKWHGTTYSMYRRKAENHVYPALGSMRVIDLDLPRVQQWVDRMEGSRSKITGNVQLLSGACRMAMRLGIITTNPVTGVEIDATPGEQKTKAWTLAEVTKVLDAVEPEPMWHALYRLALTTGMRPGELIALQWDSVDLAGSEILIRRTRSADDDGREVISDRTKTGKERAVALSPLAVVALKTWKVAQNAIRLEQPCWDDREFVFTSRMDGRYLAETTWRYYHGKLIDRLGITKIVLHGLRHTSASLDIATDRKIVSDRLGHSTTAITNDTYTHVTADTHRASVDELEERIERARRQSEPALLTKTGTGSI